MTIKRSNPPAVYGPGTYSHAVQVSGETLIYMAGQVAWDVEGNIVGQGDLEAQADKAFENVNLVLASVGSDFSKVIKLTLFIVDYKRENREKLIGVIKRYVDPLHLPASTLIGVQTLAHPDLLIEVEAIATL